MLLHIYGWNILQDQYPDISFSKKDIQEILPRNIDIGEGEINIVFVSPKDIQKLNKDFRKKDEVTDVLSFVIEEKPLIGEIYICPEYIAKKYKEEEILRNIVHGYLHLTGYDHKVEFDTQTKDMEEMFVKQENILHNILDEINSRSGKSR